MIQLVCNLTQLMAYSPAESFGVTDLVQCSIFLGL